MTVTRKLHQHFSAFARVCVCKLLSSKYYHPTDNLTFIYIARNITLQKYDFSGQNCNVQSEIVNTVNIIN